MSRGAARRRQRRLQALVTGFSRCLSSLSPQAEHLLLLRAGVGVPRPYSGRQVARLLGLNPRTEARAEKQALTKLQGAARSGNCGSSSFVSLQVPTQDHLVSWSPALTGSHPASSPTAGAFPAAASGPSVPRLLSAAHRVRSRAHSPTVLESAISLSTSTPAIWFVLAGLALLATLTMLSSLGRRFAAREQLMMAVAAPAAGILGRGTPEVEEPPRAAHADAEGPATPGADVAELGMETANPTTVGMASALPTDVAPRSSPSGAPSSFGEPSGSPAAGAVDPSRTWLQAHRTHVALGLTALAGGAARLLARRRH